MFGHSLLPVRSGGIVGGAGCATVVVDSSMSTSYSQDLRWSVIRFEWNLSLTREEVEFYLGVSTWAG